MMVDKILSMWKRATCRHEVDKLRFVRRVYDAEWETGILNGMFEYQCAKCGKMVYKRGPISCEKCEYLHVWNTGGTFCARSREMEKNCLHSKYRWWWKESKEERHLWWENKE